MIDRAAALAAALGVRIQAQRLDVRVGGEADPLALMPGERVEARVVAPLPDGRMRVAIGSLHYAMRFPIPVAAGNSVSLVYGGDQPRPTFLLSTPGAASGESLATLSSSARLLAALRAPAPEAPPASTVRPLLPAPEAPPALARALERAVTESGLFYEAHQARWVQGERALLAELRRDPRNRFALPEADETLLASENPAREPTSPRSEGAPALDQLLRAQLDVLETGRFRWHGEVWPDLRLEWEIEACDPEETSGHDQADAGWHSRFVLDLPRLGRIDAWLALRGDAVQVSLRVSRPETAHTLDAARPALEEALAAAGLRPRSVQVCHDP